MTLKNLFLIITFSLVIVACGQKEVPSETVRHLPATNLQVCVAGQEIAPPDSCNSCECVGGSILCTEIFCPTAF